MDMINYTMNYMITNLPRMKDIVEQVGIETVVAVQESIQESNGLSKKLLYFWSIFCCNSFLLFSFLKSYT